MKRLLTFVIALFITSITFNIWAQETETMYSYTWSGDNEGWTSFNVTNATDTAKQWRYANSRDEIGNEIGGASEIWQVSPEWDMSRSGDKVVKFEKYWNDGKNGALALYYTENYTGDVSSTQWTVVNANLFGDDQELTFSSKKVPSGKNKPTLTITSTSSTFRYGFKYTSPGWTGEDSDLANKNRMRLKKFTITGDKIIGGSTVKSLPYADNWAADNTGDWAVLSKVDASRTWNGKSEKILNIVSGKKVQEDYLISPELDFSSTSDKIISLKAAWNVPVGVRVALISSTDYSGDFDNATWTVIDENILAGHSIEGFSNDKYKKIEKYLSIVAPTVHLAFKYTTEAPFGDSQNETRVTEFKVSTAPKLYFSSITSGTVNFGSNIEVKCNADATVYIVPKGTSKNKTDIEAAILKVSSAVVAQTATTISLTGLTPGEYVAFAIDADAFITNASDVINIISNDNTAPLLSAVTTGNVTIGDKISATSNENGKLYLVPEGTIKDKATILALQNLVSQNAVAATAVEILTKSLSEGSYVVYAIDEVGNVSEPSAVIICKLPDTTAPILSQVTSGTVVQGDDISATVDENSKLYLVAESTAKDASVIVAIPNVVVIDAVAATVAKFTTGTLAIGNYIVYAIDNANNVSDASAVITVIAPDVTAPVLTAIATDDVEIGNGISATSNENGKIYLVKSSVNGVVADLLAADPKSVVDVVAETPVVVATTGLAEGEYVFYAVDNSNNVSEKSAVINLIVLDTDIPVLSNVTVGNIEQNTSVVATSNELGKVYLVPATTVKGFTEITTAENSMSVDAVAGSEVSISTNELPIGVYVVYAIDIAGNISDVAAEITIIDVTAPELRDLSTTELLIGETLSILTDEDATLYMVEENTGKSKNDFENLTNKVKIDINNNSSIVINTENLTAGNYVIYAIDASGNISVASAVIVVVEPDVTSPVIAELSQSSIVVGDVINAQSNENGFIYMVPAGVYTTVAELETAAGAMKFSSLSNVAIQIETLTVTDGEYELYAIDGSNNISLKSNITVVSMDSLTPKIISSSTGKVIDGVSIVVTVNKTGVVYLVPESTVRDETAIKYASFEKHISVSRNLEASIATDDVVPGSYIMYLIDEQGNISASSELIKYGTITAIGDAEMQLSVGPNPTSDFVNIESAVLIANVTLYNALGLVLDAEMSNDGNFTTVQLGGFPQGVYFVKIEDSKGNVVTKKILKK